MKETLVLGIETSCDETSAALVADGRRILSNVVASQAKLHERFGGVVPELACRAHEEVLLPTLEEAFRLAGLPYGRCDVAAVTNRPGLIGALLLGVTAAKAFALQEGVPLVAVDHLEAHLYSLPLAFPDMKTPCAMLLASGGHTAVYHWESPLSVRRLGRTIDDAAGEAFDKVAQLLGLGYPGGPRVERAARQGNPAAIRFPRALLPGTDDFSFSGLKTAVLNAVGGRERAAALSDARKADVAASFQAAAVEVLATKLGDAARRLDAPAIGVTGGVAANGPLRQAIQAIGERDGRQVCLPPLSLCTDNAAMVAGVGFHLHRAGRTAGLDLDAYPTRRAS